MKCEKINLEATFGLELESLRVTCDGFLSEKSYSFNDPRISKDFAESQMEFITGIYGSIPDLYRELALIYKKADEVIGDLPDTEREYIWPFSVPPYIKPGYDIEIAKFGEPDKHREEYRKLLAEKYDKKKMLYCGIHFNFSFSDRCLETGYKESGFVDYREYKDDRYLKLAAKIAGHTWIPVLLMGASPVFDISFTGDSEYGITVFDGEATRRCGKNGYWNNFEPVLNYSDFESYIESIKDMINRGLLYSETELYYPVRLKCHESYTLDNLHKNGTDYVEFRLLDINPLSPYGVIEDDLIFLHMFFVYLDSSDDFYDFNAYEQHNSLTRIFLAAEYDNKELRDEAKVLLYDMKIYFEGVASDRYMKALDYQIAKLENEDNLYSRIIRRIYGRDFVAKGMETAKKYSDIIEQNNIV